MNALWIKNLCAYKHTDNCISTAKIITDIKSNRRIILLKKLKLKHELAINRRVNSLQDVLLCEARQAKVFWKNFASILPKWCNFKTRTPNIHEKDIVNELLNVGYHHLANKIKRILEKYNIPPELGIIHVANETTGIPLVYDLMEMFRGDVVDAEVVRFLRLKKKPLLSITNKNISYFLNRINQRTERKYYLREFKQCQPYRYYMELQILKFIKAVNHKEVFCPIQLPSRHDNRCRS